MNFVFFNCAQMNPIIVQTLGLNDYWIVFRHLVNEIITDLTILNLIMFNQPAHGNAGD